MLCVFYGTDQIKVRQAAHAKLDEVLIQGETFTRLEADGYGVGQLASISSAGSLFSPSLVYLLETPSQNEEFWKDFIQTADLLGSSTHTFIVIEHTLLAADKKSLTKHSAVLEEYKQVSGQAFNPFALAESLSTKDKRSLWLLLQEAKREGSMAEEIIRVGSCL